MDFIVFSLLFFYYRSFHLNKELRILQLHHYQNDRQLQYVLEKQYNFKALGIRLCTHLPFLCLFFVEENEKAIFMMLLMIYCMVKKRHYDTLHIKHELVCTKRILRLYGCVYCLYTLFLFTVYQTSIFVEVSIFFMLIDKEMVLLSNILMYPLEQCIAFFYMRDAKRKLKERNDLSVVGIVGSYGKTSSKNILFELLKEHYFCLKSKSSYNNKMGNTITIRKELKRRHSLFICEMGSDHVGEIEELMHFIKPRHVLITSIGNQHLNTFKTQDAIVYEKMSPLLFLNKDDVAVLNIDNVYIDRNKQQGICRKVTFGEKEEADYRVKNISLHEWGSTFEVEYDHTIYSFTTFLLGYYNVMNIAGCIAMAHTLHVPLNTLQKLCLHIKPIEHRLYPILKRNYTLIDNAYNSNIYSFKNSLDVLRHIDAYCIFITPGLIDVKEDAIVNETIMHDVKGACDEVVLVGKRNREAMIKGLKNIAYTKYCCVDTMEEALIYVDHVAIDRYVVLIENDIDKTLMNHL